jgi:AraC-like DNA-binding protein/ligand-binding sensor protein
MNNLFLADGKLNEKLLKHHLEAYYFSTGISVSAIDEMGEITLSIGDEASFCQYFKMSRGQGCPCSQSHLYAGKLSAELGEPYVFFCPAGLVHISVPIVKNRIFAGALIAGPILMNDPDEIMVDDIIQKFQIPLNDKSEIFRSLTGVMVLGPEKVRHLSNLLFIVLTNMTPNEKGLLNLRKSKQFQQSKIGEAIHQEKHSDTIQVYYPFEKEKELLRRVKTGDVSGSKAILNELLGHVFLSTGGNIEIMKARILELCVLLSRAAVEGGASLEKIFGMNFRFISGLSKIQNIEDLSFWTAKVLERFTDNVFNLSGSKHGEIIKAAIEYINAHYSQPLTLEHVAKIVHLNSTYFSSVFNKEVGMGFTDYLNKVRIEESKKMLKNRNNTILDVAIAVGFENHSYFSKVFKKNTGLTPKAFRESV